MIYEKKRIELNYNCVEIIKLQFREDWLRGMSNRWSHIYRPQRSWGKVIFSQASVILLTGEVGCLVLGGLVSGDAWWRTPPPETATAAGGTHPTGMHSCLDYASILASQKYAANVRWEMPTCYFATFTKAKDLSSRLAKSK